MTNPPALAEVDVRWTECARCGHYHLEHERRAQAPAHTHPCLAVDAHSGRRCGCVNFRPPTPPPAAHDDPPAAG